MPNLTIISSDAEPAALIAPAFPPTPEQALALEAISSWLAEGYSLESPTARPASFPPFTGPKFFCLRGYAGTGKSYSITLLLKMGLLKPSEVCFTAPTNKAVKVLRRYLNDAGLADCPSKTIYSLLGLSLKENGEVKELASPEEPVNLQSYKLIVVDEASMVNRFLISAINEIGRAHV